MATYARVPVVPGPVLEVFTGDVLFPMHGTIARTWDPATDGTLAGYQFDGKAFTPPVAPVVDPKAEIKAQIAALEAQQTPRRYREALNGTDDGWMKAQDAQIAALRTQL